MTKVCCFLICILFQMCALYLHAAPVTQQSDLSFLFGSSLKTLTTIKIASKKEETLKHAPGIVTVITSEEIARFGARNLRDVLDRQTNMQIIGSNLFPHNKNVVRGIAKSVPDNNVLILLNGRPMRESTVSSINSDIYAYFPIDSLKSIEIIRGPGSVLYGSNAFSGVINLVTKDVQDDTLRTASLSYGSFDYKKGQLSGGGAWGDLKLFGTAQIINSGGYKHQNVIDQSGNTGTYKTGLDGEQILVNVEYKGLTVNAYHANTSSDHAYVQLTLPGEQIELKRQFVDMGYGYNISDTWRVSTNVSYHSHMNKYRFNPTSNVISSTGHDYLLEITSTMEPSKELDIVFGGTFRNYMSSGTIEFDTYSHSFYSQFDYKLLDWLNVIGGLQYNKQKEIAKDVSPRFSLIAQFDEHWGGKLLYGKAYREVSGSRRFLDTGFLLGDPSLLPETIVTMDAQIFYEYQQLSLAATYYQSRQEDLIIQVFGSPSTFINSGSIDYEGVELEGKWFIDKNWSLVGNLSYQTNEDSDGLKNNTYAPDWMIKVGASYNALNGVTWSIFNSYFAASTLQNERTNNVIIHNLPADSYNLLTANLTVNVGEYLNQPTLSNVILSLYGDNLFNEDIYFPSMRDRMVNSVPHHAGRGIYATFNIGF